MGRAKPRAGYLKSSRKFDVPLFAAAWARGKVQASSADEAKDAKAQADGLVIFSGGGGEGHHGIKSKIIVARFNQEDEELSEEVAGLSTGVAPAFKLAVHPNGDIIMATFEKDCKAYRLVIGAGGEKGVVLEEAVEQNLGPLKREEEQKCLVFSPDGARLGSGDEQGRVTVVEWPSMDVAMDVKKGHTSSLRDADFNLDGTLLVTTADFGPARVWDVQSGTAAATLSLLAGCRFGSCRFSRDERKPFLFATAVKGGGGYIVVWDTRTWRQLGVKKIHNDPICSFAVNSTSSLLATGTTEGDIAVVDMKKMAVLQRVPAAHMVFITGIQFSPDDKYLLSVSGDSSVRVTTVTAKPSGPTPLLGVLFFVLLFILSIALATWFASSDLAQRFFQFPLGRDQPAFPYLRQWPGGQADGQGEAQEAGSLGGEL